MSMISGLWELDREDIEGGNASGCTPTVSVPKHSRWKISFDDNGAGVQATLSLIRSRMIGVGALAADRHSTQMEG